MTFWSTPTIKAAGQQSKRSRWLLLGIFLVILCSCTFTTPERSFTVQDLLIDVDALPANWAVSSISDRPIVHFGQDEAIRMSFYYLPDLSGYTRGGITIYQHSSERRARRAYSTQEKVHILGDGHWSTTPPFIPNGFNYASEAADRSGFACLGTTSDGLFEDRTVCTYLAQYEKFVVYLTIAMDKNDQVIITGEELEDLVAAIDGRFAEYFLSDR